MTAIHGELIQNGNIKKFSTDGLLYLPYCMDSGEIYSEVCVYDPRGNRRDFGYFTEDNKPNTTCSRHIMCFYDSVTKAIACPKCPKENLVGVALISVPTRSFPKQIQITDAEYVYRYLTGYEKRPTDYSLPYFFYIIPDGEYVGISDNRKQFNSNCHIHYE